MTTGAEMPDSPTVTAERFIPDLLPLVRPIAGLKIDPRNARKHPSSNLDSVKQSLLTSGQVKPIVVVADGTIIAGNGLVLAAQALGWMKIAAVTYPDAKTARRYALADNRTAELAEWDDDMLADEMKLLLDDGVDLTDDGWAADEIAKLTGSGAGGDCGDPEPQIDRAEELRKKWGVERGQVWTLGAHRLMCGDSTKAEDVARLMDSARPALMVTDPPYGIAYDPEWRDEVRPGNTSGGHVAGDDRADWSDAYRHFSGAVAYVWHSPATAHIFRDSLVTCGFDVRAQVVWKKPYATLTRGDYHPQHEVCWYAVRHGEGSGFVGLKTETTVWDMVQPKDPYGRSGEDKTPHPTQKPVEAMDHPLRNHDGDVYDPFLGSGTTLIAAERLGRRCYAMELDPGYVAVAIQRWVDATGGTPRKEGA